MTYEFNASDVATNDFPSPYKVENLFLWVSACLLTIGGVLVMLVARAYMATKSDAAAIVSAVLAVGMLSVAVKMAMRALSQMRFFLGRDFPSGLAGQLKGAERGAGEGSAALQEQIRHQAVVFEEPTGLLSGVLYSIIKPLNSAPPMIQHEAVRHFHTMVSMTSVLCSLAVSCMLFAGTKHEGVVSWAYLPLTGLSLATPFMQADEKNAPPDSNTMLWRILGMTLFAMVGPVLVQRFVPAYNIPAMWLAPVSLLIGSIVATILFLASLFSQIDNITQTSVSCEQTTIDMNCLPAQLWTELGRSFHSGWVHGIPNRKYVDMPPEIGEYSRGMFQGNLLEESHPELVGVPFGRRLKDALAVPHGRCLVLLCLWGMGLALTATVLAPGYAAKFVDMSRMEISRSLLTIIALCTASILSFRIGHLLWSRMYFKSRVVWVDVSGTYQTSELDVGNQITGNVRSKSSLTRVEDATLRVWVTDIVSVAFGKEGGRFIMALRPSDGYARALAEQLKVFAATQSTVVAPTSERDLHKVESLRRLDQVMGKRGSDGMQRRVASTAAIEAPRRLSHERGALAGQVKFFDREKGFGFLRGDDGVERFFGASQVQNGDLIRPGQKVRFVEGSSRRGPSANSVALAST